MKVGALLLMLSILGCPDPPARVQVNRDEGPASTDLGDSGDSEEPPLEDSAVPDEPDVPPVDPCSVLPVDITPGQGKSALNYLATGLAGSRLAGLSVLESGDIVTAGIISGPTMWLARISPDGTTKDTLVAGVKSAAAGMVQLKDGRLLVGGREGDGTLVVAVDSSGDGLELVSEHRFERQEQARLHGLSATPDGGAIFVGRLVETAPPSSGQWRPWWIVKLDANLDIEWETSYPGTRANAVTLDGEGGYVSIGFRTANEASKEAAWLIHTDADGGLLANREFMDSPDNEKAAAITTWDYGFMAAGETESLGCGAQDGMIIRVSAQGTPQGSPRVMGSTGSDTLKAIVRTGGRWLAVGEREMQSEPAGQAWLVVMDDAFELTQYAFLSGAPGAFDAIAALGTDGTLVLSGSHFAEDATSGFIVVTGPNGELLHR